MKKHILTLMIALFIGAASAFAQGLAPQPVTCIDLTDPLKPVPGNPYTYEVTVPTPPGAKTYHWFVTQDINFINAGVLTPDRETIGGPILAAGSGQYNSPTLDASSLSLTWKSFVLTPDEYVFVVIQVTNVDPANGCETENLKVYRIEPAHAFTLDIANVGADGSIQAGYGQTALETCMSDIESATYNPVDDNVIYDFGQNTLYFAVAAANFSGQYQLGIQFNGLLANQTADISWGYTFAGAGSNVVASGIGAPGYNNDAAGVVQAQAASGNVGSDGETIYIMVVIHHDNFEGIVAVDYTLAVEGVLHDGTSVIPGDYADIHHTSCEQNAYDDIAYQTIAPRPDIQDATGSPSGTFLPIAP
jgi:hypothetical protein